MAGYLKGAARGLGRGMADVGGAHMASNIDEARRKRLAKYAHDLGAEDREASAALDERRVSVAEGQLGVAQDTVGVNREKNALAGRKQGYIEFSNALNDIMSQKQAIMDHRAEQQSLGIEMSPEQNQGLANEEKALARAYGALLNANPEHAKRLGRDPATFGNLDSAQAGQESVGSDMAASAPEPTLREQRWEQHKQTRQAADQSARKAEIDQILNDASGVLQAKPSGKWNAMSGLPSESQMKSETTLSELDKIYADPLATPEQKERAQSIYNQFAP